MNIVYLKKGLARMEVEVKEEFTNPNDICHGGIGFSILDTAMSMAVRTIGKEITTVEMNINYLRPAQKGDILTAVGKILKDGNKIIVGEGELYNQDNKLLANARETFYMIDHLF
jgi:acyl-CoA thioesterase